VKVHVKTILRNIGANNRTRQRFGPCATNSCPSTRRGRVKMRSPKITRRGVPRSSAAVGESSDLLGAETLCDVIADRSRSPLQKS
jgi:hypothetical protein